MCALFTRSVDGWSPLLTRIGGSSSDFTLRHGTLQYAHNTDNLSYVVNNGWVQTWQFNVTAFSSESYYDWLGYKKATDPNPSSKLSGTPSFGYYGVSNAGGQTTPIEMEWYADGSYSSSGVTIDGMRACCAESQTSGTLQFPRHQRVTGNLFGSGDVVYLTFPGNSDSSIHEALVMWSYASGADFDIYARCGAKPTASDYRSDSTGNFETIHFGGGACGSSWYVAIKSFSGSGNFNLMWTQHKSTQHRDLRAGFNFTAGSADLATARTELTNWARAVFGATEGNSYIASITLYNNVPGSGGSSGQCGQCGGQTCDVCFWGTTNTSFGSSTGCSGTIQNTVNADWTGNVFYTYTNMVHEWGHTGQCLGHEYCNSSVSGCATYPPGVDGSVIFNQSNHCPMFNAQDDRNHNFCIDRTWLKDGYFSDGSSGSVLPNTNPQGESCWRHFQSKVTYMPTTTPDNYDFVDFTPNATISPDWVGKTIN